MLSYANTTKMSRHIIRIDHARNLDIHGEYWSGELIPLASSALNLTSILRAYVKTIKALHRHFHFAKSFRSPAMLSGVLLALSAPLLLQTVLSTPVDATQGNMSDWSSVSLY